MCEKTQTALFDLGGPGIEPGELRRIWSVTTTTTPRGRRSLRTDLIVRCKSVAPVLITPQSDEKPIPFQRAHWVWRLGIELTQS